MTAIFRPLEVSYQSAYSLIDRISYHLENKINLTSYVFKLTFQVQKSGSKETTPFLLRTNNIFQLPKKDAGLLNLLQTQAKWYLESSNKISPRIRKYLNDLIACTSPEDFYAKTALSKVRSTYDPTGFIEVKFMLEWLFKEFKQLGERAKVQKFSIILNGLSTLPKMNCRIKITPLKKKWSLSNC